MKRIWRQAASSGLLAGGGLGLARSAPRPAHSSPSSGVAGQPAVNQAGRRLRSPPRVRSVRPSQKPRTPSYFSLTQ
jgi:hypothetical protein